MKNIFKYIGNWFHYNYKFDGFVQMILFGCITLIILVGNICTLSNDRIDWFLFAFELIFTLWMADRWQTLKRLDEYKENTKLIVDQSFDIAKTTADLLFVEHERLIAANRRRKRAERKLRKQREKYRYAMERNIELLHGLFDRNRKL